jgi:hypothetical protein
MILIRKDPINLRRQKPAHRLLSAHLVWKMLSLKFALPNGS